MLARVLQAALLIVLTTAVHGAATAASVRWSQQARSADSTLARVAFVPALVLVLLFVSLLESSIWALYYVVTHQLGSFSDALYFSLITMTTVGYGDITLSGAGRVTSGMQAALGVVLFGWTTAIIFTAVQAVHLKPRSDGDGPPRRN